jgi:hypothetical protein
MALFLRGGASGARAAGRRSRRALAVPAATSAVALAALTMIAPTPQTMAQTSLGTGGQAAAGEVAARSLAAGGPRSQVLTVPEGAAGASVVRDGFAAKSGLENLSKGSTNHDWAVLVLYMAGFPTTESNVTVMLRWMRQENGPDNWWLRNNPLNNGWGSGGGSGLGSYDDLVTAAENVGNALHGNSGYAAIVAGFAASAPTAQIEQAIWASPWATSHYANGGHWSYSPVPEVASPAGTWG